MKPFTAPFKPGYDVCCNQAWQSVYLRLAGMWFDGNFVQCFVL